MKKLTCLLFLVIATMFLSEICEASICEPVNTVVYFGNGIATSHKEATYSKILVSKRLRDSLPESEYMLIQFDVSYNKTNGLLPDLFEASLQDLQTDISLFWRILGGTVMMPDWFENLMNDMAGLVDEISLVTTDSLQDHVIDYKTKIAEGKKVLLVAHSQGNFFGNQSYGLLNGTERQSFGIVSVANPDSFVANNGPYTTLLNDVVIWAVIFIKTQAGATSVPMLPYMVNSPGDFNDITGHFFIESYMVDDSNSDAKITGDMINVLGNLVASRQIIEPGVITVSLTWGSEPDVDLHVYEPNGSHVFWYTPEGFSGFLDKDDVSRWGPEHYTVSTCDTLERGTYEVALDYYLGNDPETAIVQVEAGLKVRVFKVPMPSEAYGTPLSPVHLTSIRVYEAANGGYEFEIY